MYFSDHKFAVEIEGKGKLTEIKTKKNKNRKNTLTSNFFRGLILLQKVLIFFLKLIKYKITLLNQMKKNH